MINLNSSKIQSEKNLKIFLEVLIGIVYPNIFLSKTLENCNLSKPNFHSIFFSCRFLADADWDTVEKSCEITDPYKTTDEEVNIDI